MEGGKQLPQQPNKWHNVESVWVYVGMYCVCGAQSTKNTLTCRQCLKAAIISWTSCTKLTHIDPSRHSLRCCLNGDLKALQLLECHLRNGMQKRVCVRCLRCGHWLSQNWLTCRITVAPISPVHTKGHHYLWCQGERNRGTTKKRCIFK